MKYKNHIKSILTLSIISILFFSCEKEDDDPIDITTPTPTYFMSASIGGVPTTYPKCQVDTFQFFANGDFNLSGYYNFLALTPIIKTTLDFDVYDPNFVVKKDTTYSLADNALFTARYTSDLNNFDDSSVYYSNGGQIRFTQIGPEIYEGTFNLIVTRSDNSKSISISNGSFKGDLRKQ